MLLHDITKGQRVDSSIEQEHIFSSLGALVAVVEWELHLVAQPPS